MYLTPAPLLPGEGKLISFEAKLGQCQRKYDLTPTRITLYNEQYIILIIGQ